MWFSHSGANKLLVANIAARPPNSSHFLMSCEFHSSVTLLADINHPITNKVVGNRPVSSDRINHTAGVSHPNGQEDPPGKHKPGGPWGSGSLVHRSMVGNETRRYRQ